MSWLARSLANSLRIDDNDGEDDEDSDVDRHPSQDSPSTSSGLDEPHNLQQEEESSQPQYNEIESETEAQARGVKDDLNEIKETLSRQLRGMASFLAPPPTHSQPSSPDRRIQYDPAGFSWNQSESCDQCVSGNEEEFDAQDDTAISTIRRDFPDTQGRFGTELSEIKGNGPNLNSFESDSVENEEREMENCDLECAVGITEEVLAFAWNIAMHPETWLDFPIDEEEDTDDFDMSDAQQQHALAIERLAPRLAALRIELCPCHMSESYFWKVYFVLLHSRLNKQDAEVLSSPQAMEARAMWMQELQKQMKPESDWFGRSTSYSRETDWHEDFAHRDLDDIYSDDVPHGTYRYGSGTLSMLADYETEKHIVASSETHYLDKSVIEEKPMIKTVDKDLTSGRSSRIILQDYEDDEDEWPDEDSDLGGYEGATNPMVNEEDISFSDLEDDDYDIKPVKSNTEPKASKT
ncbi:hypothetical protein L6164_015528 [Bauhinia variegata]|uniref:Uncharacterized protein n=1 Tax=Bauhinia variegata TaxID=167791 RepID=A0ACB9NQS6_BAUVA|nr:hypothetical protein L6164_015528 [Bauhinia variegata]